LLVTKSALIERRAEEGYALTALGRELLAPPKALQAASVCEGYDPRLHVVATQALKGSQIRVRLYRMRLDADEARRTGAFGAIRSLVGIGWHGGDFDGAHRILCTLI